MVWQPSSAELAAAEGVLSECFDNVQAGSPDGYYRALATAVLQAAHDAHESVGEAMGVLAAPINPGPCIERVSPDMAARYREAGNGQLADLLETGLGR